MSWICDDCGKAAIKKENKKQFRISTWHIAICEWCGKKKAVTEDRDFNYPAKPKKE